MGLPSRRKARFGVWMVHSVFRRGVCQGMVYTGMKNAIFGRNVDNYHICGG